MITMWSVGHTSDKRINLEDTKRFIREEETNARYNPSTDLFDSFTCVENIIEGKYEERNLSYTKIREWRSKNLI